MSTWSGANIVTYVTYYVDQQTMKPDHDYILLHQRLLEVLRFDVFVCPMLATRAFPVAAARLRNSLRSHVTAAPLSVSLHLLLSY